MLSNGTVELDAPESTLSLIRSSQTVAALKSKAPEHFDFMRGDLLVERSQNGYYHLGDIDLLLRSGANGEWKSYSTVLARVPVAAQPACGNVLAAADLSPTLAAEIPLRIVRAWLVEDGKLPLEKATKWFATRNQSSERRRAKPSPSLRAPALD